MRYRELHRWDVSPADAARIQTELRERLVLRDDFQEIQVIAGADVSVEKEAAEGYAGVIAYSFPELREIERQSAARKLTFPYIPGLLIFREGPVLLEAFAALECEPDLIIFDGQGLAHQRRLGIASHMGILLDRPTIGCAKSVLVGKYQEPGQEVGAQSPLVDKGEVVGAALRTRTGVQPVFVSQGHRISLKTAIEVVLKCLDGYRIPKPTREADHFVEAVKRERSAPGRPPSLPLR